MRNTAELAAMVGSEVDVWRAGQVGVSHGFLVKIHHDTDQIQISYPLPGRGEEPDAVTEIISLYKVDRIERRHRAQYGLIMYEAALQPEPEAATT